MPPSATFPSVGSFTYSNSECHSWPRLAFSDTVELWHDIPLRFLNFPYSPPQDVNFPPFPHICIMSPNLRMARTISSSCGYSMSFSSVSSVWIWHFDLLILWSLKFNYTIHATDNSWRAWAVPFDWNPGRVENYRACFASEVWWLPAKLDWY